MACETGQPATAAEDAATAPAEGATALVEGTDYEVIRNGQPWMPLNGKIEVVEVFGYVCPACFRLAPIFAQWKAGLPPDVRVSYVPAPFGAQWTPYAKAYFAAESLGLVDRTHDAMFSAIHIENVLPGEGETPDPDAVAQWYGQHGGNAAQFRAAMDSFATDAKVNRGKQWMARSGVGGTPTIIVNGKYRITGGRSYQDVLHIADQLIAMERAAGASAGS